LQLAGPVTTRARASGDGLRFQDFSKFGFPGSFTDDAGVFYLLEPLAPELTPDMDAIREAHNARIYHPTIVRSDPHTALGRFERSMQMDYQKWHDGDGYDLDALRRSTPAERNAIEAMLLRRGAQDWRDVEALAALATPRTAVVLKTAAGSSDAAIRMAVMRHAPHLVTDTQRVTCLVTALESASLYEGLSQALDQAAEFHPKEVVDALLRGTLQRDGETAVHFAALLMFLHGQASEPFDWDQRPFFLRFNTGNHQERNAVFLELCRKIGVDPADFV
jgi:hypothetical protein